MNNKNKISVVISAFNEEKKIEDCLKSVKDFADEIIFVDNSSTDKTVEIAKKYTSKIYIRENNSMLNINKNFGFTKALNEWILCLDADERISLELKDEINEKIKDPGIIAYWIPRKNIIFGKWIKHTGWYPDFQLRLFKNGKGSFAEKHVHEMIVVDGKADYIKGDILHYNFESIAQFFHKHVNIYAPNEAEDLLRKGYIIDWKDAINFPLKEFISRFFTREGYKDGFHGLMLSLFMAVYHLIIFSYIWENQGFKEVIDKNVLHESEKEFKKSYKEMLYWFYTKKIDSSKNLIQKNFFKVKKRFRFFI